MPFPSSQKSRSKEAGAQLLGFLPQLLGPPRLAGPPVKVSQRGLGQIRIALRLDE
jgi:hypothetical protein